MMRRLVKRCMYVCMIDEPGSTGSNARFMADSVSYMLEYIYTYLRSKKNTRIAYHTFAGWLSLLVFWLRTVFSHLQVTFVTEHPAF